MARGNAPSFLALHMDAAMLTPASVARSGRPVPRTLLIALATVALACVPVIAQAEFPRFFRGLTAPFRAAHRQAPPLPADPCLEQLAEEVAWLEHHVAHYGSIVAKAPDVWGQNLLTQHRAQY